MRTVVTLLLCALLCIPTLTAAQPTTKDGLIKARDSKVAHDRSYRRQPIPDASPTEVPDRTPRSYAVFDTLFAHRGERVTEVFFVHGFSPGGSRDISAAQLARIRPGGYLIGATDAERFDGRRNTRHLSQMHNISLGIARANFVNAKTGYRSTVLPQVIFNNDLRGVYQVFTVPVTPARKDTVVVLQREIIREHPAEPVSFFRHVKPFVGLTLLAGDGGSYFTPQVGVAIVAPPFMPFDWIYVSDGWIPDERGDRIRTAGVQFGERGLFGRIGFRGGWTVDRDTELSFDKAVGGEGSIGYAWKYADASVTLGSYHFSSVSNRQGEWQPGIGFLFRVAPNY